jgi:hypothetical protein
MRGDFRSLAMIGTGAMASCLRHAAAGTRLKVQSCESGHVYLELADATPAEADGGWRCARSSWGKRRSWLTQVA